MSLNRVMIIGNLGKDPEVKYTQSQTAIANLAIATTERKKGADGQWTDHTEWHTVVTFGKTAENCGQYLTKGKKVFVEGSLRTRKWQDKAGQDRYSTEIVAQNVQFLSAKGEGSPRGDDLSSGMERSYSNSGPSFNPSAAGSGIAPVAFDDDDIPF